MTRSLVFFVATILAAAAAAQTPQSTPPASASTAETAAERAGPEAVRAQGFTYSPEGRRDPFVSLLRRGSDNEPPPLPASGLAGLTTDEVNLRGTMESRGGYVGILQASDNKSYVVRAGDKLADGTIRLIVADAVVIEQRVADPLSVESAREVRKTLRDAGDANQ